jgi:hypothetical protein
MMIFKAKTNMEDLIMIRVEGSENIIKFLRSFVSLNSSEKETSKRYVKFVNEGTKYMIFKCRDFFAKIVMKKTEKIPLEITFL